MRFSTVYFFSRLGFSYNYTFDKKESVLKKNAEQNNFMF